MAQDERWGTRDRAYSAWHRRGSTGRYIGIEQAQLLAMIDLDVILYVEYDDETKEPIALIEAAQDIGQPYKCATVTQKLAERAGLPAYVVLYRVGNGSNPAEMDCRDIVGFRIKRLCPNAEYEWREMTPKEYAEGLLKMRSWKTKQIDSELFGDGQPF